MWGELAGVGDVLQKVFPRASAYGGRLWAYKDPLSAKDAGIPSLMATVLVCLTVWQGLRSRSMRTAF